MLWLVLVLVAFARAVPADTPHDVTKQIESLYWMTEEYPPFNYVDEADGQLKGITVDVLMRMFERAGVNLTRHDLHVLPWQRSYQKVLHEPNTVLFSTTYTMERLQELRFVGPIIPTRVSIVAPRQAGLTITSVADLESLRIGVIRDDVGHQLIRAAGVGEEAIHSIPTPLGMVRMLAVGRLDAIAYAEDVARYQFTLANIDPDDFESVYILKQSYMGYAFHLDTDPRILEPLRKALDELHTDGTVARIYESYLHKPMSTHQGGLK